MTLDTASETGNSPSWNAIFERYNIYNHDFDVEPFLISSPEIGAACQDFTRPSEKEARILCKQDSREDRPQVFREKGLFILPVRNNSMQSSKVKGTWTFQPFRRLCWNIAAIFPLNWKRHV